MTYRSLLILFGLSLNSPDHSLAVSQISNSCLYSYFNSSAFNQSVVSDAFKNSSFSQPEILNCLNKRDFNQSAIRTCLSSSYFNESLILSGLADVCCNLKEAFPNYLLMCLFVLLDMRNIATAMLRIATSYSFLCRARHVKRGRFKIEDIIQNEDSDTDQMLGMSPSCLAILIVDNPWLRENAIFTMRDFEKLNKKLPALVLINEVVLYNVFGSSMGALILSAGTMGFFVSNLIMHYTEHKPNCLLYRNEFNADMNTMPLYLFILFCYIDRAAKHIALHPIPYRHVPPYIFLIFGHMFLGIALCDMRMNAEPLIVLSTMLDVFIYLIPFGLLSSLLYFKGCIVNKLVTKHRFFVPMYRWFSFERYEDVRITAYCCAIVAFVCFRRICLSLEKN